MVSRYGGITGSKRISEDFQNINTAFENVEADVDARKNETDKVKADLEAHKNSISAHAAQNITYTGKAVGNNTKDAIDYTNDRIDNLIITGGDSSPEVADARGGYPVLSARLNASDAQLAAMSLNVKYPPTPLIAAKGDGITDDTNAIKACVDYAIANEITTILVPPASYVVNDLKVSGNLTLLCKGATFISGDNRTILFTNWSGHLVGLKIESNSTSDSINVIQMSNCSNVTLSEITINPCGYIGIYLHQCKNVVLDRIFITNYGAVGIYTETCERILATRCNIVGGNKTTSHCIQFNRGRYNMAVDNYLEKGQAFAISFVQESRSQALNNTCYNSYAEAINLEGSSNCLVDGNNCFWDLGVSTDFGICIYGPDTSKYANLNIVTNNIITRCGKAGIALADLCLFNKVSNNSIYDGNQLGVTDVDGMITLYQQAGTTGPANNMISDNSGSGDKFNYLIKENIGDGNYFNNNYIKSYKPSQTTSSGSIIQNPQLTWLNYSPSITAVNGAITSLSIDKAEYAFDGEFIRLNIKFRITTNGTGAGQIRVPLPISAASGDIANGSFTAVETEVSGVTLYVNLTTSEMYIRKYDGSYPGANGVVIQLSGYYNYLR